jgi:hypothetical protein
MLYHSRMTSESLDAGQAMDLTAFFLLGKRLSSRLWSLVSARNVLLPSFSLMDLGGAVRVRVHISEAREQSREIITGRLCCGSISIHGLTRMQYERLDQRHAYWDKPSLANYRQNLNTCEIVRRNDSPAAVFGTPPRGTILLADLLSPLQSVYPKLTSSSSSDYLSLHTHLATCTEWRPITPHFLMACPVSTVSKAINVL